MSPSIWGELGTKIRKKPVNWIFQDGTKYFIFANLAKLDIFLP